MLRRSAPPCPAAPRDVVPSIDTANDFRPGDQIFFAGQDFESRAIALRTAGKRNLLAGRWISHVGTCCHSDSVGGTILVESTTFCEQPCIISGQRIKGVQAHYPAQRVAVYKGHAWRLRLRRPLDAEESCKLTAFLVGEIGKPYNYARAAQLATFFVRQIPEAPLADTWFCDELSIEACKVIDRVGHDDDPEQYSPGTFLSLVLRSAAVWPIGNDPTRSIKLK